jgi:hypothetical protein
LIEGQGIVGIPGPSSVIRLAPALSLHCDCPMRELLDQKLARFEQLENDLINP